jgi:UDP-N-acetylmuramoylalanine-D-glutamate ligase
MRAADLGSRRVAIWGWAAKGERQSGFCEDIIDLPLVLLNDTQKRAPLRNMGAMSHSPLARPNRQRAHRVDVIVKSPGVSLYRDDSDPQKWGANNLIAEPGSPKSQSHNNAVTGTKGKSTTATLIAHLTRLGRRVALPEYRGSVTRSTTRICVIEVSSYQAADFDGLCDLESAIAAEHADWHLTVSVCSRQSQFVGRGRCRVINVTASDAVDRIITPSPVASTCSTRAVFTRRAPKSSMVGIGLEMCATPISSERTDPTCARHLRCEILELDLTAALYRPATSADCAPAAELGERRDILFVDDSISTIPDRRSQPWRFMLIAMSR